MKRPTPVDQSPTDFKTCSIFVRQRSVGWCPVREERKRYQSCVFARNFPQRTDRNKTSSVLPGSGSCRPPGSREWKNQRHVNSAGYCSKVRHNPVIITSRISRLLNCGFVKFMRVHEFVDEMLQNFPRNGKCRHFKSVSCMKRITEALDQISEQFSACPDMVPPSSQQIHHSARRKRTLEYFDDITYKTGRRNETGSRGYSGRRSG